MSAEPTILYVEDDPFSRLVMELLLTRGMNLHNVTIFESSENFMSRLGAMPNKPTLIFLDIHMQPYDGFALLEMLRTQPDYRDTRIVALTASVMNEEVEALKTAGFDGVIAKPINQTEFPDTLRRIMNGERVWIIS